MYAMSRRRFPVLVTRTLSTLYVGYKEIEDWKTFQLQFNGQFAVDPSSGTTGACVILRRCINIKSIVDRCLNMGREPSR